MTNGSKAALINARANREGGKVDGTPAQLAELSALGLVGPLHGLTRAGVIRRERLLHEMYEEMF